MASLFGRTRKTRPRESSVSGTDLRSVPYELVAPGSPPAVGKQPKISAPITNPGLTANGTDLNIHTMTPRPRREPSPTKSTYTTASAALSDNDLTLVSDSADSFAHVHPAARRLRQSDHSQGRRSPSPSPHFPPSASSASFASSVRPMSTATTSTSRSDSHRASRYAQSVLSAEGLLHRYPHADDAPIVRPSTDAEIEAMFDRVLRMRDLGPLPPMSIDQKWHLVESDEQLRRKEERTRKEHARRGEPGRPAPLEEGSPEWFLKKFLDRTITLKQASSLHVSLRSNDIDWFRQFIEIRGTPVLAQTLQHISRKGAQRYDTDNSLEYELVRCLKVIFNHQYATEEALTHKGLVAQITSTLNTPRLTTRRIIIDLLTFLVYWPDGDVLDLVLDALEQLSTFNGEAATPFAYWFKSMEHTLEGRGRMGSLVGASEEVRRGAAGADGSLNDYALTNLLLINGILNNVDDLDVRLHLRTQMEAAGLPQIVALCRAFGEPKIDKQLDELEAHIAADEADLRARLDNDILHNMSSLEDVYAALTERTRGSRAADYFLSMLQHLLLIREEGPGLAHYYQLLDSLVTDVVMDRKLAGAENRLGQSVERIIAQFNDADQFRVVEAEAARARADARRAQLEKEALEEELARGSDGLVGVMKGQLAALEEKLAAGRENVVRLQGQLETQKAGYEEQIEQLEAQIMELFRMLREVGRGVDQILDRSERGGMDRKTLMETLEKHLQRTKTIERLEGREGESGQRKRRTRKGVSAFEDATSDEEATVTPGRSRKKGKKGGPAQRQEDAGRTSQFMDADEAMVQEKINQQLAQGVRIYAPRDENVSSPRSMNRSPRPKDRRLLPETPSARSKGPHLLPGTAGEDGSDAESEYDQSTVSNLTEDTQATSVTSSVDAAPGAAEAELGRQLAHAACVA
ncbi:armadillo-type protein [Vararia minispora EC-137]|uniref:Armadillo-type protein n=1 Tax=Vararia minispora EC-137 TaxID=1314806 RepID=A0ACB8QCC4_9AGAM|nr:armadillo-type protein [Vararia minispora EC-137]